MNKRFLWTMIHLLAGICCILSACSNDEKDADDPDLDKQVQELRSWIPRVQVSEKAVAIVGIDLCFEQTEISDRLMERMWKKSYKADCTVPREELRYLKVLHRNSTGNPSMGEMVCNKNIAEDLLEIFRVLYDNRYPIERMVLVDEYDADDERSMTDNNSSCFNFRFVAGTTRLSNHSLGYAIDINPLYNPYIKMLNGSLYISPLAGKEYTDRSKDFPFKIDEEDLALKEFKKRGFTWGEIGKTSKITSISKK